MQEFSFLHIPPWLVLGVIKRFLTRVQEQGHWQFCSWWLPQFCLALWRSQHPGTTPQGCQYCPCLSGAVLFPVTPPGPAVSVGTCFKSTGCQGFVVVCGRIGDSSFPFVELHFVRGSQSSVTVTAVSYNSQPKHCVSFMLSPTTPIPDSWQPWIP